jgi:hypothetical protein
VRKAYEYEIIAQLATQATAEEFCANDYKGWLVDIEN